MTLKKTFDRMMRRITFIFSNFKYANCKIKILKRVLGLLAIIVISSCTANKKVVDDEFAADSVAEESSASSDEAAVSEDDLFAENSMSDAGSDPKTDEQAAKTEPEQPGSDLQATDQQQATSENPTANSEPKDEFSEFDQPTESPTDNAQAAQEPAPTEPALQELNLENEISQTDAPPPAEIVEPAAPAVTPPPALAAEPAPVITPEPVPLVSSSSDNGIVPPPSELTQIKDVQFRGNENGGALIIKANRELQFTTRLNSATNQIVVELENVEVPKKLMRPLITKDMSSSIGTIDIYKKSNSTTARFVIQLRSDSPEPLIQPEGTTLLVIGTPMGLAKKPFNNSVTAPLAQNNQSGDITQPSLKTDSTDGSVLQNQTAPQPQDYSNNNGKPSPSFEEPSAPLPQSQYGSQLPNSVIPLQVDGSSVNIKAKGLDLAGNASLNRDIFAKGLLSSRDLQDFLTNNNRYFGKKISIVTQDLEIRDVLNFLSEESSVNLIYDDDVSGKVNIKLRRVPWDQALVTLLKSKKLGYQRQGSILRIAKIETLIKEEEEAVKIRDARADQEPLVVRNFRINYADISSLETKIKEFINETKANAVNRGRVSSDARTNTIIVTETPSKLKRVEELILALDGQPQQVQIEARIIEASESFSKTIGTKWGLNNGKNLDSSLPAPFNIGRVATKIGETPQSAMPSASMSPSVGLGGILNTELWFGQIGAFGDLQLGLSLAQVENKIKVLSSPRIVVLSGTSANVNQQVRVRVPDETTTVQAGTGGTTTNSKTVTVEAGVALNVTPQISNIDTVRLKLNLTKSIIKNSKGDIDSRNATSEVILKSLQTAVIGGVFESQQVEDRSGVPGLQDIPILGAIFRGKSELSTKSELMIFVTPKILAPVTNPMDHLSMMPSVGSPTGGQNKSGLIEGAEAKAPSEPLVDPAAPSDPLPEATLETTEDELKLE